MKILIELPSWLGDTIMATPALENIFNYYKTAEIILIGSNLSVEVLKSHPNVSKIFVLNKNVFTLLKYRYKFGELDIFISFRGSYRSKLLRLLISSKLKYQFDKTKFINSHQVEKYNNFINYSLNINSLPGDLILSGQKLIEKSKKNKILGKNLK